MSKIIATNQGGGDFELSPAGMHVARCVRMVHIGTVKDSFQGVEKDFNKVLITFELPNATKEFVEGEGEKPFIVDKEFTLSMNEKSNLRKMLASWRGVDFTPDEAAEFDVSKLLGVPCMINVIHKTSANKRQYQDVTAITPLPNGTEAPEQITESLLFGYDPFDVNAYNLLPEWIQKKIQGAREFEAIAPTLKPAEMGDNLDAALDQPDAESAAKVSGGLTQTKKLPF